MEALATSVDWTKIVTTNVASRIFVELVWLMILVRRMMIAISTASRVSAKTVILGTIANGTVIAITIVV